MLGVIGVGVWYFCLGRISRTLGADSLCKVHEDISLASSRWENFKTSFSSQYKSFNLRGLFPDIWHLHLHTQNCHLSAQMTARGWFSSHLHQYKTQENPFSLNILQYKRVLREEIYIRSVSFLCERCDELISDFTILLHPSICHAVCKKWRLF